MSVDLVCGAPAFLDLTFVGLEALPAPGEERFADDLVRSPGGAAIIAIGAARLGLTVALAAPLGRDEAGDFIRAALADEGIRWVGSSVPRTPTAVILPAAGDRAMVTFAPADESGAAPLAASDTRAAVVSLPQVARSPDGVDLYVTVGDDDTRRAGAELPARLAEARALFANEREALALTGAGDAAAAAWALAAYAPCVVVTLGREGALAVADGGLVQAGGHPADAVDATGAGDLFAAAYVWADLAGAPLLDRLRWAVLYAALSVGVPTAAAGAKTLAALVAAGAEHGLTAPVGRLPVSLEEGER